MPGELIMRCPRLGGEVPLRYCMREGGELPCRRILMCWRRSIPIEPFLREKLTDEQWERLFFEPPASKMATIVECVEAARKANR